VGAARMITKIQAAEHQLDTAIRLFFENIDLLSSYTLAAASREITDDLCEKKTHEIFRQEFARLGDALKVHLSFREEMKIYIKKEYYKDAMNLFRKRQNFLKHADKDPDGEIDDLNDHELELVIFFAGKNFSLLEKRLTPAMSIFLHWFGAAEPRMLKQRSGTHREFIKLIDGLRGTFQDFYSKEAFRVMHEALQQHYQPK
jgi:hypothetical protein